MPLVSNTFSLLLLLYFNIPRPGLTFLIFLTAFLILVGLKYAILYPGVT